jgi:hypothetical protein
MIWKLRYQQAHQKHFQNAYPNAWKDGLYTNPQIPNPKTANGLTKIVNNFLNWEEHRSTRINVSGRLIDGTEKQPSGVVLHVKKWMPSTTRRGTADISATINGKAVMLEIKVGNDKPSEFQIAEQIRERRAGGIYEFLSTPEQFFALYDFILKMDK